MRYLICSHLANPAKGKHDFLLLSSADERVLACTICYEEPGAILRAKDVSRHFFDCLVAEMTLMQKRQTTN